MNDSEAYDKNEKIEFMPISIRDEIKRGILHQRIYKECRPTSYRVYTDYEKRKLPLASRKYLFELEQEGYISSLQREWIIDSVLDSSEIAKLERVPMPVIVATAFLILSIESMKPHELPEKILAIQEVSLRLH